MQANGLNSDASKSDREELSCMLEEMFEESDIWLVPESHIVRQVGLADCYTPSAAACLILVNGLELP